MRRLAPDQYEARLSRKFPHIRPLEPYCKANIPLPALCERCGNTITRDAAAHLRFDCPHCSRTTSHRDDPDP